MSIPPFPDAPITEVTRDFLEASVLVVVRHEQATMADLQTIFDGSFGALRRAIDAGLFVPDGPAIAVYYGDPRATFDLEVGFPVVAAPTADIPLEGETLRTSALPAGDAAFYSHVGPWDGLGEAWGHLSANAGGEPRGIWIEAYVSDPMTTPQDQLRTDLVMPLA